MLMGLVFIIDIVHHCLSLFECEPAVWVSFIKILLSVHSECLQKCWKTYIPSSFTCWAGELYRWLTKSCTQWMIWANHVNVSISVIVARIFLYCGFWNSKFWSNERKQNLQTGMFRQGACLCSFLCDESGS